ncbi:lipoyl(octanoyl) transferase LipB [Megasphaera sueciensis]|uniref:lipoyl(octanoyl) transferase LipB n=1 Tax=Megasphaera sueciensis TaxID=349094 RepID=UPI003D0400E2
MTRKICSIYLGCQPYNVGLEYQRQAKNLVLQGIWDAVFLIIEHPPVITIGMHGGDTHLLVTDDWLKIHHVDLFHTNRGGDITCHNPGQLICYPIINLKKWNTDVHWYVQQIEESIIRTLKRLGITAGRKALYSGVWVGNKKIAAVGIGVKHWITYHGIALNVCNDLELFSHIIPCGITDFGVTNLRELHCHMSAETVVPLMQDGFISVFPHDTYSNFTYWGDLYGTKNFRKTEMAGTACL